MEIQSQREHVEERSFYAYDERYCLHLHPHYSEHPEKISLAVSDHSFIDLARYAYVNFELPTGPVELFLYCLWGDTNPKQLEIPFKDLTNGKTTYEGGRNLAVKINPDRSILLDLNKAANMFCSHADQFITALPPKENWLEIEIPVGEKFP